jgi:hypothetical protein
VALPGAPIMPMPILLPVPMESEGVAAAYMLLLTPVGGAPRADRSMSFIRMYWYFELRDTGVKVAMGRGW